MRRGWDFALRRPDLTPMREPTACNPLGIAGSRAEWLRCRCEEHRLFAEPPEIPAGGVVFQLTDLGAGAVYSAIGVDNRAGRRGQPVGQQRHTRARSGRRVIYIPAKRRALLP